MAKTKWLVTGAAGFLGSSLTEQLAKRGDSILAVDNLSWGNRKNVRGYPKAPGKFQFLKADIRDDRAMTAAFKKFKPDYVVHLAALHYIPAAIANPDLTVSINVLGSQVILSQCIKNSVKGFYYASTGDVYLPSEQPHREEHTVNPNNIYGLSKWMGEKLIQLESQTVNTVIGRLFNLIGPRETNPHILPEIILQLKKTKKKKLKLGNIFPKRDFLSTADASKAIIELCLKNLSGIQTVNIASGEARSMSELIQMIQSLLRTTIEIEIDPKRVRKVERPHLQADVQKLKEINGWTPSTQCQTTLQAILKDEGLL